MHSLEVPREITSPLPYQVGMKTRLLVPEPITQLFANQADVVSRQQVLSSGGSQELIDSQLRDGGWIRLGQGVYSCVPNPTFESICWGGILRAARPSAAVGGGAAAHLWGITRERPARITIWGAEQTRTAGPWRFRRGEREALGTLPRIPVVDAALNGPAKGRLVRSWIA